MRKLVGLMLALALLMSLAAAGASAEDSADGTIVTGSGTFTVEEALQRALDYEEIQSLAGKHEYYHTALMHEEELNDIWAQEHEITWTNNTQKYVGWDNVYSFYVTDLQSHVDSCLSAANAIDSSIEVSEENEGTGILWYHMLTTPVIEIAGDGQTARGIWMSFGTVTEPSGDSLTANWTCESYGIDFVKENGAWKIWHLRTYVYFYSSVDGHWYDASDNLAVSGDSTGSAPTGVGVIYDAQDGQAADASADAPAESADGASAAPSGAPEAPNGGEGGQSTTPAETGTFFTGYSLSKIAESAEIPEPYETWSDLTTSY